MPWSGKDALKHTKAAKSEKDQRLWNAVANRLLKDTGDEGKAIRIANSQVRRKS